MTHLGALFQEVKPLDLNTRTVVNASHEPEFRGTKFVNEAKNQHAIELFRVTNEAILKSFLRNSSIVKSPTAHREAETAKAHRG